MINAHTSWQPLRTVIVGRAYTPDYFDFIDDPQVRAQLQQILAETAEDLDNLQRTIETYGARVLRPDLMPLREFERKQLTGQPIPLPPLTPRDWQIALGDQLLRINPMLELNGILEEFQANIINPHTDRSDLSGPVPQWAARWSPDCPLSGASASCIVRVGEDIFFDNSAYLRPEQTAWIVDNCLDSRYRIHEAVTDGHGDAVFAILKPGVILSSKHDENLHFDRDFPGWEVLRIMDSSIDAAIRVGEFKQENFNGSWYVTGQTPTQEFARYIDTYLQHWVGYVKETVFDVNCLVLDEHAVIFSAYNRQVFDWCEQHRITPIISPLRHSYFWDGGISCCTQDLERAGGLERYL